MHILGGSRSGQRRLCWRRCERRYPTVLGLMIDNLPVRLNALKQAISISVNIVATIFFLFPDRVISTTAIVMHAGPW
jgi:hypothetical protein